MHREDGSLSSGLVSSGRSGDFSLTTYFLMSHFRTSSEAQCSQSAVTLSYLLKVVNPDRLGHICLDDMVSNRQKHVLDRVPEACRPRVKSVFHDFIFQYRSFKLPVDLFISLYEKTTKARAPSRSKPSASPTNAKKPANASLELQRRMKNLSQERQFITYDNAFRAKLSSDRGNATLSRTPQNRDRTHQRRISEEVQQRAKGCSYSGLHQRKVSLRKEQEWEDIKLAQALAINKARSRSPATLETEMENTLTVQTKCHYFQGLLVDETAEEIDKSTTNNVLE